MRHSIPTLTVVLLLATPALADPPLDPPAPDASAAEWATFSENLVHALATGNDGVKAAVLQHIICYSGRLDVDDAQFDVVRIYRSHPNIRMRRLALVAIGHLGSNWAIGFLRMSDAFEPDPVLRATLRAVVHEFEARKLL